MGRALDAAGAPRLSHNGSHHAGGGQRERHEPRGISRFVENEPYSIHRVTRMDMHMYAWFSTAAAGAALGLRHLHRRSSTSNQHWGAFLHEDDIVLLILETHTTISEHCEEKVVAVSRIGAGRTRGLEGHISVLLRRVANASAIVFSIVNVDAYALGRDLGDGGVDYLPESGRAWRKRPFSCKVRQVGCGHRYCCGGNGAKVQDQQAQETDVAILIGKLYYNSTNHRDNIFGARDNIFGAHTN